MYQAIVSIHSKHLLSGAVAGYAFYLIASNFANIQFFRFTAHITKGLSVETDQSPQMLSVSVSHQICLSCCNVVSLSELSFVLAT